MAFKFKYPWSCVSEMVEFKWWQLGFEACLLVHYILRLKQWTPKYTWRECLDLGTSGPPQSSAQPVGCILSLSGSRKNLWLPRETSNLAVSLPAVSEHTDCFMSKLHFTLRLSVSLLFIFITNILAWWTNLSTILSYCLPHILSRPPLLTWKQFFKKLFSNWARVIIFMAINSF